MTIGSFVHGALVDMSPGDLDRMLELDETLFVEHKRDLGEDSNYGLAKAVSAFANTLGGWLLLGVENGMPHGSTASWISPGQGPTLVDMVRDRLRGEVDPLPAFEARVITHRDGSVGVVRIYESADTPHVMLQSGSVFVREVAGDVDVANPGRPGARSRGERIYRATQIRSRAELLELAARGAAAAQRVQALVDPTRPLPLTNGHLLLKFAHTANGLEAVMFDRGLIAVRVAPYSLPSRFRSWVTTAEGANAALSALENLADIHGLATGWSTPHASGVSVAIQVHPPALLSDASGFALDAEARVTLDRAGVAGAALLFAGPHDSGRRSRISLKQLADSLIRPAIEAALAMLAAGEFLGRCWCQVDLVGLPAALLLADEGNRSPGGWVPTGADLALPASDDQVQAVARQAAYAYARSAGLAAWDPPLGVG
jgi:Putative DNA-binding domain